MTLRFSIEVTLFAPGLRQVEGDAGDALDLVGVVDLRIDGALLAVADVADLLRLAEIDAAGQLAQDQDVEPLDQLALQRRGVGERRIADGGAEIGEDAELLAQPQQRRLRALLVGHLVPFRPADRAEDHRIGGERLRHRRLGDRHAMRVVGGAADQILLDLEGAEPGLVHEGDDRLHLGHDLRADAVAGKKEDAVRHLGIAGEEAETALLLGPPRLRNVRVRPHPMIGGPRFDCRPGYRESVGDVSRHHPTSRPVANLPLDSLQQAAFGNSPIHLRNFDPGRMFLASKDSLAGSGSAGGYDN